MTRNRSRKRRSNTGKKAMAILLLVASIFGFGAISFYWLIESNKPELDEVSLCPTTGPVGYLSILIDTTDPLSLTQVQNARQRIESKIVQIPKGTRVSLSVVSPQYAVRDKAFYSICKPPSGDQVSNFSQNPKLIQERYEKEFLKPIQETLNSLLTISSADSSPIMEALQEFLTRTPEFVINDTKKEMVIMSDLIQHNAEYSFYRGFSWEKFVSVGGTAHLSRNLQGSEVTVLRIPRSNIDLESVDDFWVRYFEAQGVSRINVHTIGNL